MSLSSRQKFLLDVSRIADFCRAEYGYILKNPLILSKFSSVCTITGAPCALFATLPLASNVRVRPKTMLHCVIEIGLGILTFWRLNYFFKL